MDTREITNWYTADLMDDVPDNIGTRKLTELNVTNTRDEHVSFTLNYANPPFNGEAFSMTDWVYAFMQELFNDADINEVIFRANECYISYKPGLFTERPEKIEDIKQLIQDVYDEGELTLNVTFSLEWNSISIAPIG